MTRRSYRGLSWLLCAVAGVALGVGSGRVVAQPAEQTALKVQVSDVVDYRGAGENSLLAVGLSIKGVPENVERQHVLVSTATDSVGSDLRKPGDISDTSGLSSGWEAAFASGNSTSFDANLKNPSRQALKIARLEGRVEMLIPRRDPDATVLLSNRRKYLGRPLEAGALGKNNISLRLLTSFQFNALTAEERQKVAPNFSPINRDAILFVLSDPEGRLAEAQFQKPDGGVIAANSLSSIENQSNFAMSFEQPLPPDARLKLLIATPKATVRVPFSFSNIELP